MAKIQKGGEARFRLSTVTGFCFKEVYTNRGIKPLFLYILNTVDISSLPDYDKIAFEYSTKR